MSHPRHRTDGRPRPANGRPVRQTPDPTKHAHPAPGPLPPLLMGGQGRTAQEVGASAEALLVAIMVGGVVALVVALGHVARWFA